jgi:hypothetical protein
MILASQASHTGSNPVTRIFTLIIDLAYRIDECKILLKTLSLFVFRESQQE